MFREENFRVKDEMEKQCLGAKSFDPKNITF